MASLEAVPNDRRGWILCIVSAVACTFGASIVCVDLFVRLLPGKKDFRIQDSNVFLSCSLSLSFGVMIFSSLFSMLPSSKQYLVADGHSEQLAGLLMMAAFVVGFFGIQVISRLIHDLMPSHVVDCGHTHADAVEEDDNADCHRVTVLHPSESTPLLHRPSSRVSISVASSVDDNGLPLTRPGHCPSMRQVSRRLLSFVKDTKANCDEFGPCFGYSEPCGQECIRNLSARSPAPLHDLPPPEHPLPPLHHSTTTGSLATASGTRPTTPSLTEAPEPWQASSDSVFEPEAVPDDVCTPRPLSMDGHSSHGNHYSSHHHHSHHGHPPDLEAGPSAPTTAHGGASQHHHHVPTNAFMSIGLQTVLAIGLHKFPEGFITFATNHANPELGFSVFLALLVHNVSEGFAMALPLYMALGSRLRAILWASALGGLSQPLGAGMAAIWLRYMGREAGAGNEADGTAYGLLFAVTAGIMVAVALQLFVEGLTLHHDRQLIVLFAFVGMLLLGLSSSLVQH